MKKYLDCIVTVSTNGRVFSNPLKLSEAHLVSKLARENYKVEVFCVETDAKTYKSIFG